MMDNNNKFIYRMNGTKSIITDFAFNKFWLSENHFNNIDLPESLSFLEKKTDSFFNVHDIIELKDIDLFLLGFPSSEGSNMSGSLVNSFPNVLRKSSHSFTNYIDCFLGKMSGILDLHADRIVWENTLLRDLGNISEAQIGQNNNQDLFDEVYRFSHSNGSNVCTIGGDHSLTYYAINGLKKIHPNKRIILFQFDAHHDCGYSPNHREGNMDHANFVKYLLDDDHLLAIIQIGGRGLRSIDQLYEHNKLYQFGLQEIRSNEWKEKLMALPIDFQSEGVIGYVSFDTDVIDPKIFPWVDFPIYDGFDVNEVKSIIDIIYSLPTNICGFDIVEGKSGGEGFEYHPIISILIHLIDKHGRKIRKNL